MDKNDELYEKLVKLFKLFKNRPYHLSKFLIDNDAFKKHFLNKVNKSNKLQDPKPLDTTYIKDISKMKDYFDSYLDDILINKKIDRTIQINKKLDEFLSEERYEDAIRIRDYMKKNNIKRLNF